MSSSFSSIRNKQNIYGCSGGGGKEKDHHHSFFFMKRVTTTTTPYSSSSKETETILHRKQKQADGSPLVVAREDSNPSPHSSPIQQIRFQWNSPFPWKLIMSTTPLMTRRILSSWFSSSSIHENEKVENQNETENEDENVEENENEIKVKVKNEKPKKNKDTKSKKKKDKYKEGKEGEDYHILSMGEPLSLQQPSLCTELESYTFFLLQENQDQDQDTEDGSDTLITSFSLLPHEKGWSVKLVEYGLFVVIRTSGTEQTIEFTSEKPSSMSLTSTRIRFSKKDYPFTFRYERNAQCDDIFHDFVETHLPVIDPSEGGGTYSVPVKCTSQLISYRQYIGYMKTCTLFQFTIEERGWVLKRRYDEGDERTKKKSTGESEWIEKQSSSVIVKGVDVRLRHEWTFFPWGSRIDHQLMFI